MSEQSTKRSNWPSYLAVGFIAAVGGGLFYDANYNEQELTSETGEPIMFQAEAIQPNSKDGYSNIYMEHGQTPYMFRTPNDQVANLEIGDCFNATVTGLYVAAMNGDLDKLRAPEITEVPCPE